METLQRTANRGSISTAAYEIDNSLKLESANAEYLYVTRDASGSDWNRLLWTASMWVKHIPTEDSATAPKERMFGASDAQSDFDIRFRGQPIGFRNNSDVDGVGELRTTAVYRDISAWYHVVAVWDTANGTAGNRMRLYVNGEEVTDFSVDTQPSQNEKSIWGKKNDGTDGDVVHAIGGYVNASTGAAQFLNGYLAEVHWVEGAALAPTEFGEFDSASGIWKPKEADVTYGTNGFYLNFDDSSALGADSSGNSNNWSLNNIAAADQSTDTPTNNFCTFNAINMYGSTATLAEGATFTASTGNGAFTTYGTMAPSSGKWWWEGKIQVNGSTAYACIGATTNLAGLPAVSAQLSGGHVIKLAKGQKWVLNDTGYNYGAQYEDGSIINIGLDLDNRRFYSYKNGTVDDANGIDISSTTFDGFGSQWMPLVITYGDGGASSYEINFGGYRTYSISSAASDANGYGTFEYAPPSGYYSLCTKNLAEYG